MINHENRSEGGRGARRGKKGSDKVSNRKEPSADTDFLDDENDEDYEPSVRKTL